MRKAVFLDVDGVLNSHHMMDIRDTVFELDDTFLSRLADIVQGTNADIILTSAWATGFDQDENGVRVAKKEDGSLSKMGVALESGLASYGLTIHALVTDVKYLREPRGQEIAAFLEKNPYEKWIIIDDENHDFTPEQRKHLIKTTYSHKDGLSKEGLTAKLTQKAIEKLL